MADRAPTEQAAHPLLIANRYQVEKTLGQGGMAVVYQALGDSPPFAEMDTLVKNFLLAETDFNEGLTIQSDDPQGALERTSKWTSQQDEMRHPLLLGHTTQEGFAITGVAILLPSPGKLFNFPRDTVAAISKSLFDAGDVVAVYT